MTTCSVITLKKNTEKVKKKIFFFGHESMEDRQNRVNGGGAS